MATNKNGILFANSVGLDTKIRLVKSKEKENAINESNQVPEGGIMVIVQYGSTRYVKITDGQKKMSEIPKDGEGGSGGGITSVNGDTGPAVVLGASDVGADPEGAAGLAEANAAQYTDDTIANLNLGTASQSDVGDFATAAQGDLANTAVQPADIANVVESNQQGGAGVLINNIIQVTQTEYDGLTPQSGTFYAIVGE